MITIDEKIFHFVYICAMRDATQQRAFKGPKTWLYDTADAEKAVRKYIDIVIRTGFSNETEHKVFFISTAKEVCERINNFTFGNAQKLISMTAKYFYVKCYQDPELRGHFQFCYCPMDSVMLRKVWKEYAKGKMKSAEFNKSWSQEEWGEDGLPDRYKYFQKAVKELASRKHMYPIEYDFAEWGK